MPERIQVSRTVTLEKYNPNHEPGGTPIGGQFAPKKGNLTTREARRARGKALAARLAAAAAVTNATFPASSAASYDEPAPDLPMDPGPGATVNPELKSIYGDYFPNISMFKAHVESFSELKQALEDYQQENWQTLNESLRAGKGVPRGSKMQAMLLDDAIESNTLEKPVRLWKGAYMDPGGFKPGTEFTDHGYLSMSRSREVSEYFAMPMMKTYETEDDFEDRMWDMKSEYQIFFTVVLRKGTKAAPVDVVGGGPNKIAQHEFLLKRGSRFRVKKWSKHMPDWGVEATVIELEQL